MALPVEEGWELYRLSGHQRDLQKVLFESFMHLEKLLQAPGTERSLLISNLFLQLHSVGLPVTCEARGKAVH